MNENILELKNMSVLIKERFLVKNVTLNVQKGESFAVIGEDKSGKTSLIKAIAGSLPINQGQVFVNGKDIKSDINALKTVNLCLDPPMFFKFQTVYENLHYLSMLSENASKEKILTVLNKFNLADKMKTKVLKLSYYEKKLMALALAFLTEPEILLLDEPFKGLPKVLAQEIKKYLKELQEKGTSILITSTTLDNLDDLCDKFVFMENRKVKEILTKAECLKLSQGETYAFVEVKYPHYAGKLIMENFDLKVKLYEKKVLFLADEEKTAKIVSFLSKKNIAIYKAGFLNKKSEKIFAQLTPFFKEEDQ